MNEPAHPHPYGRSQSSQPFAKSLGIFSIALGLTELLAPKALAKYIGVKSRPGLFGALGLREITSGIGILSQRKPTGWMWSRVAGDVMDLTLLATAYAKEKTDHQRIQSAAAFVAGATIADLICALQLTWSHDRGIHVEKSVLIDRPAHEIYCFWRDFENLPRFMNHLESVEITGEKTSHWVAKIVGGKSVKWDAEIINEQPAEMIAWQTLPGAEVAQAGTVRFEPTADGTATAVRVNIVFYPPGGVFGAKLARLIGEDPAKQIESDLTRLRGVMEAGAVVV